MKKILLTGGGGFIGSHCLALLARRGEVIATTTRPQRRGGTGVRWVHGDLLDLAWVARLIDGERPTHLLHLAWITTPGEYWTSPLNAKWQQAGEHLLEAFLAAGGRRAVLGGTCAEYNWTSDVCHETETPLKAASPYSAAKDALRRFAQRRADEAGASLAWARVFFPYGPGEPAAKLVTSTIRSLLRGEPAACSAGTQQRDFIYVEDVAEALVHLLDSDVQGAVNIGTGAAVAVRDVVRQIGLQLGRPELIRIGARPGGDEPPLVVADNGRLREVVGYHPHWTLEDGIAATIAACRAQAQEAR